MESTARHTNGTRTNRRDSGSAQNLLSLLALMATGTALGALLWQLVGPPEIPSSLPGLQGLRDALSGSTVSDNDVVSVVTGIGWATLAYLGATIALRVLCESAIRATRGAAWARTALRFTDLFTLPPIRRMVNGAIGGVLLAGVWFRPGVSLAADAPVVATVVATERHDVAHELPVQDADYGDLKMSSSREAVSYTVVVGDSLWGIAQRFYGNGSLYASIFEANKGKTMATGEVFTDPRVIRPGWVVEVPMPAQNVQPSGDHIKYTVRHGDSLWRIAESFLGGGLRWTEIWELNKGRDMGAGRTLTDPGNILPGWVLELPVAASSGDAEPIAEPSKPLTPSPSAVPTPVATTEATLQPTPTPASPSPTPFLMPGPAGDGGGGTFDVPSPPLGGTVLAVAAGVGGIGGLALIVRQIHRRNGSLSPSAVRGKHSTGDAGRVDLAARSLLQALRELGFDDVRLLLVRETERVLDFTIDCAPGDADALIRSRFDVGRRLACAVDADGASRTRVQFKLSRFHRLAGMLLDHPIATPTVLLVPVGASQNGIHYLNLAAVGSVLLTGDPTETSQMTSSWMSSLRTLRQADQLAFVSARPDDPNARTASQLATELEEAIVSREAAGQREGRPAILSLAVLGEPPIEDVTRLDTVVHRGPEHGIFIVCVANRPVEISNMLGARLTFHDGDGEPDGLTFTVGRDAPVELMPVTVRAQSLTRHADSAPGPGTELRDLDTERDAYHGSEVDPPALASDPIEESAMTPSPGTPVDGADTAEGGQRDDDAGISGEPADAPQIEAPAEARGAPTQPEVVMETAPAPVDTTSVLGSSSQASRQAALMVAEPEAPDAEAHPDSAPFDIHCFGTFQVLARGQEVDGWTIQKARELLAYLIARGGTRVSREEAADALWPEEPADRVGHLLSNAAYYVRRTLKEATPGPNGRFLTVKEQRYQLQSGIFRVDLDAFDAHLRRAETLQGADALIEYDRALAIYRGDFLGNEPYEWAEAYRRDYQRRFIAAAHEAGRIAQDCRDVKKAIEFYQAILDRDPIDEEAARSLMRCHAKLGDTNAVRKVYKTLTESLRRELEDESAEPLPETMVLWRELADRAAESPPFSNSRAPG
jgi:DNA-binding SARP family transcriptional activator